MLKSGVGRSSSTLPPIFVRTKKFVPLPTLEKLSSCFVFLFTKNHFIMAKGSIISLMKGKLGQIVLYKVTNSNNKQTQGAREYVAEVANPQTAAQNAQRMKLAPAANFYRGLAVILDHSWQGVKYGNDSRQYFMKMALSNANGSVFPFVLKGEKRFIPGEYPISRGSLAPVFVNDINANQQIISSLADNGDLDVTGPFASVVASLLQSNPTLAAQDQVTVVATYEHDDSYYPLYRRILLNVNDFGDTEAQSFQTICHKNGMEITSVDGQLAFRLGSLVGEGDDAEFQAISDVCVGAAIIISRRNGDGNQTSNWLRSAADLFVTDEFLAKWMSAEQYAAAIASYSKSTTATTSNYYLNQSGNENAGAPAIEQVSVASNVLFPQLTGTPFQLILSQVYDPSTNKSYYVIEETVDSWDTYRLLSTVATGTWVEMDSITKTAAPAGPAFEFKTRAQADAILGRDSSNPGRYPAPDHRIPEDSDFLSIITVDLPASATGTAGKVSAVLQKGEDNGYSIEIPIDRTSAGGSGYPQGCFEADGFEFTASPVQIIDADAFNTIRVALTEKAKAAMGGTDPTDVEVLGWAETKSAWPFLSFTF